MRKCRILLSGVGGSLFPYLIDKLSSVYDLYLVDGNPLIKKLYEGLNFFTVPLVSDPSYEIEIIKIIKKFEIDYYIPLIDEELLKAIELSKTLNVKVLTPNKEFIEISLNKFNLMQKLKELNISEIQTVFANDVIDNKLNYPVFLKPNVGRGSRGIKKIDNKEQFDAYFLFEEYTKEEILVQPYIDGQEYTVSVTVNNKNQIIAIVPKIVYSKVGITKYAKAIHHDKIEQISKMIVQSLTPHGSFNVQLKEENGKIKIFEINPRFSTTLVLSIESGVNEIELSIENYDKENVRYIESFEELSLIRRWENIFVKEDKDV